MPRYVTSFVRITFCPWQSSLTFSVFLFLVKITTSIFSKFTDSSLDLHLVSIFLRPLCINSASVFRFCRLPSLQDLLHIPLLGILQYFVTEAGCISTNTIGEVIVPYPEGRLWQFFLPYYCLGRLIGYSYTSAYIAIHFIVVLPTFAISWHFNAILWQ